VAYRFSEAYSGLTLERPKLNELRELIRNQHIDVLVIYCLDRLSRNATHGVILRDELDKYRIVFESVTEDIDKTPLGEAITYLRGTFSQIEAEKIRERTMRGKRAYLTKGKMPQGTGIGIYGFNWDKENKRRIPLDYEVKVVQKAFTMYDEGIGFFNIAKSLNEHKIPTKSGSKWNPFTIRRMLTNTSYIGLTYFGKNSGSKKTKLVSRDKKDWKLLPDVTPPIVSEELFYRVQDKMGRSREIHAALPHREYLLTGYIVCAECGSPVVGACLSRKHRYYHCRSTYPTAIRGKTCNARYIRADYIEEVVWKNVREVLEYPEVIVAEVKRQTDEQSKQSLQESDYKQGITKLERKLRNYEKQERQLIALLRHGEVTKDYILDEINKLKSDCQADEEELQKLKKTTEELSFITDAEIKLNEFCQRVRQNLDNMNIHDKRLALEALDIRVTASTQSIDIKGIIPVEFPTLLSSTDVTTTAQTWGCRHALKSKKSSFSHLK